MQSSVTLLRRRLGAIIARCHALLGNFVRPYRPELHYMRGPGPKWHARQHLGRAD
ncbi:hypothetical protein [Bradyrhizobium lablabi]|uniref:hypothetical protein n=1 Tax=Bradyrhizobium lablabi TaxID=722472 RepID=UPI001BAD143F|nr:hypothetical protein [Bradyrhizobium lablabi]MBR0692926.1 hypothetical protein [Bradyrhizobium lablabi]